MRCSVCDAELKTPAERKSGICSECEEAIVETAKDMARDIAAKVLGRVG